MLRYSAISGSPDFVYSVLRHVHAWQVEKCVVDDMTCKRIHVDLDTFVQTSEQRVSYV